MPFLPLEKNSPRELSIYYRNLKGVKKMKKLLGGELARLTALRSVCLPGEGRVSQVYVSRGNFYDPRRICSLLEAVARHFAVDIVALRQRCKGLLGRSNYLPLPLNSQLVLVPLTLGTLGEKTGYINLLELDKVQSQGKLCSIVLKDGVELPCWLSPGTVKERLMQARFVLWELSMAGLVPVTGYQDLWREKLEVIRRIIE